MKRRNLCNTKKLMAVILAASMVMSSGVTAFAGELIGTTDFDPDYSRVTVDDAIKDSDTTVSGDVEGEVYASSVDNNDSEKKDATAKITVDGDVNVKNEDNNASYGINASSISNSEADTGAATNVTVTGSVDVKDDTETATGVQAIAYSFGTDSNATTTVTVKEEVSASSNSEAVGLAVHSITEVSHGGNGDSAASVHAGSVSSESGNGTSVGIIITASENQDESPANSTATATSTATAIVDGDVEATSVKGSAYGIQVWTVSPEAKAKVDIEGNLTATSNADSDGYACAEAIQIEEVSGELDIDVGGSVTQEGEKGFAIALPDSSDGNITITVGKNVTATTTAVNIVDGDEASGGKVDLTVKGEISGGEYNIALGKNASLDDVNITVWKVDTSENKAVVVKDKTDYTSYDAALAEYYAEYKWAKENDDYSKLEKMTYPTQPDPKYEQDTEAEKKVNYIIHVQSDVSIASGTRKVNGYDTAHQDETVTFAVTVPSGYEIENFFNVSPGNIISLNKGSADGTYLLTVPRGGGVDIGVSLKKLQDNTSSSNPSADYVSRTESGASDGEYWSPGYNRNGNAGGVYVGYDTAQIQGLQVHSMSIGGDVVQNITDVLTPVDTLTAFNNFEGTSLASIDMNNVMGSGIVNFNDLFIYSISDTVEVPVSADVYANQSYTVMFSDGTSMVVTCAMNGVLNIPFSKNAKGLTYIIYKTEVNPAMFMGMPEATGWTY